MAHIVPATPFGLVSPVRVETANDSGVIIKNVVARGR